MKLAILVDALAQRGRGIADWSAIRREIVRVEARPGEARAVSGAIAGARIHVDGQTGRGSADLTIAATTPPADLQRRLDEAVVRAASASGPSWRSSPPAAPAKVDLADRRVDVSIEGARELLAQLAGAAGKASAALVDAAVALERTRVSIATSRGQVARWTETLVTFDARVAAGGATTRARAAVRRLAELKLADAIADAAARAKRRATAAESPAGPRAAILPAALLGGDGAALLDLLAGLGHAARHRQGLAPVGVGAAIAAGAADAAEPFGLASDGTIPFGLRSAPLDDHGAPVRRFPIVEGGVLVGLGLDEREAALRGAPANGGVRNLVIADGASEAAALRADGALELHELTHVDVDRFSGRGAIGIGLATLHEAGGARAVTGRELQGDLVAAFARSRRTAGAPVTAGAYRGPALVSLAGLAIV